MELPASANVTGAQKLGAIIDGIGITRAHKIIVALIMIGMVFDVFEQDTIGVAGPLLRAQFGLSATGLVLLNSLTFVALGLGKMLAGYVGDRYGRKVTLSWNLAIFSIGSLFCALTSSYALLCVGRFIVGLGLGGELSIAITMLAEIIPTRLRASAVGLLNVGAGGFGNLLAPAFGLLIFAFFPGADGWRWLFGALALPALLLVFFRRYVPETPRYLLANGRIGELNTVLSSMASGRLRASPGEATVYMDAADAPAGGMAAQTHAFSIWEIFTGQYLRPTIAVGVATWMSYGAQISLLVLMPTLLVSQGYSIQRSLTFTIVMQSGSLIGSACSSYLSYYFPRKWVLSGSAILGCLSGLAYGLLAHNIFLILLFGACFQLAVLLLNTTIWAFAPELYPTRIRGFGTSFLTGLGNFAGAVMPLFAGLVFDRAGIPAMFTMMAAMFLILVVAVQFCPETFGKTLEELHPDLPSFALAGRPELHPAE